jgi:16S rRNA (cytidine1402-2'-O)-methyltransferase
MIGKLSIVATPIGNLEDITLRALRMLREADLVAAEDTRRVAKLLNHFEISVKTISYHSHNEHKKTDSILDKVEAGENVVIVSDAGTPCIADPGFLAVREAVARGIEPEVIPGVSALTFAAVASGLPVVNFSFFGFLPVKKGRRERVLEQIKSEARTAFIYESPYRMEKVLKHISEVFPPETKVAIIREATKLHEEVIRGSIIELIDELADKNWKGECVIVISPEVEEAKPKPKGNKYENCNS